MRIIVTILLLLAVHPLAVEAFDEPKGYKSALWGDSEKEIRRKFQFPPDNELTGDALCMGVPFRNRLCSKVETVDGIRLRINFVLRNDKLGRIELGFKDREYDVMARAFVARFGAPTRQQGKDMTWEGTDVVVEMTKGGASFTVRSFASAEATAPQAPPAGPRPAPPPADMQATADRPGYAVDPRTGCWIWMPSLQPNQTVNWSGPCGVDGRATGRGALEIRRDDKLAQFAGDLRDGKPHGQGVLITERGSRYEGEWRDGQQTGRGSMDFAGGGRYEGEWRAGVPHGRGTWTKTNGDRYEGEWRDGKENGDGIFTTRFGSRYEGEWRDGKWHGRGAWKGSNGDRYEGEFREGREHGRGVQTLSNGSRYEGEWRDGKENGRGAWSGPTGNRYEGEWRDGRPDGFGEGWINGSRLVGNWAGGCFRDRSSRAAIGRALSECP